MADSDDRGVKVSRKNIYEIRAGDKSLQLTEDEAVELLEGLGNAVSQKPSGGGRAPEEISTSTVPSEKKVQTAQQVAKPAKPRELTPKQRRRQTMIMSGIVIVVVAAAFVAFNVQFAPHGSTGPQLPPKGPYEHFTVTGEGDITFNGTRPGPAMTAPDNTTVWVTFTVSSTSSIAHSWVLVPGNTSHNLTTPDITPVFANATSPNPTVGSAPGHTDQIVFKVTKPGTYLYICEVPGHFQEGMYGYFNVTASNITSNATALTAQAQHAQGYSAPSRTEQSLLQASATGKFQITDLLVAQSKW